MIELTVENVAIGLGLIAVAGMVACYLLGYSAGKIEGINAAEEVLRRKVSR